ncbi:hypothetical protein [Pseudomonas sp. EA_105y_Pfl2_R69]|uniref:hypothetical protein n=1 Tax=Pseudomonas sp. EA_105y_Pfl2_R69 TaxID=3088683 RepID=UPI0030DCEAD2
MTKPAENDSAAIICSHWVWYIESKGSDSDNIFPCSSVAAVYPKNALVKSANAETTQAMKIKTSSDLRVLARITPAATLDIAKNINKI